MGLGVCLWWFGREKVTYIHTERQTPLFYIYRLPNFVKKFY